ncbi:MAG: hypothetical protein ABIZ04_00895 [Opitutus sp.]
MHASFTPRRAESSLSHRIIATTLEASKKVDFNDMQSVEIRRFRFRSVNDPQDGPAGTRIEVEFNSAQSPGKSAPVRIVHTVETGFGPRLQEALTALRDYFAEHGERWAAGTLFTLKIDEWISIGYVLGNLHQVQSVIVLDHPSGDIKFVSGEYAKLSQFADAFES